RRLSPLRLGSPVRRFRQLHRPRSDLRLLISAADLVAVSKASHFARKRFCRGFASSTGASSTPVLNPTRPVVPPGGSTFLGYRPGACARRPAHRDVSAMSPNTRQRTVAAADGSDRCCSHVTQRCHLTAIADALLAIANYLQ